MVEIPLVGEAADPEREISGLAWYRDELILMAQHPHPSQPAFYAIARSRLLAATEGRDRDPIQPRKILLQGLDYRRSIPGYEGFEALSFNGDEVYLLLEANHEGRMMGYLVGGRIDSSAHRIILDPGRMVALKPPVNIANMAFEALLAHRHRLLAFFEANGSRVNTAPRGAVFDYHLKPEPALPIPALEYRLTDVTASDSAGRFWGLNYYWPGERQVLKPAADPLAARYGQGATHRRHEQVERLVEFKLTDRGVRFSGRPPIQLRLDPKGARNWEGLARLEGHGFLLITDEHPRTILAFVPFAN